MLKMRKVLLIFTLLLGMTSFGFSAIKQIESADQITMECLKEIADQTGYTDHIPHFRRIFENYQVSGLVEFGLGFSTKYFLDHCDKVISVEFVTHGSGPEWMKECLHLFRGYSHWMPITYFSGYQGETSWARYPFHGSDAVYKAASYQCAKMKNYALIDPSYLRELDHFIVDLVQDCRIDVGFVDAGLLIRGDLVQLLFNKVPIIVAHDATDRTSPQGEDPYGYLRIVTPSNYEEFFVPKGMGTLIWIEKKDELHLLRQTIRNYIDRGEWWDS